MTPKEVQERKRQQDYRDFHKDIEILQREGKRNAPVDENDLVSLLEGNEEFPWKTRTTIKDTVDILEIYPELIPQVPENIRHFFDKYSINWTAGRMGSSNTVIASKIDGIRDFHLREGTKFVLPNGTEFIVGKRIKDEFGLAVELINTETKQKFFTGLEKAVKFLRREKAQLVSNAVIASELVKIAKALLGSQVRKLSNWEQGRIADDWTKHSRGYVREGKWRSGMQVEWQGGQWMIWEIVRDNNAPDGITLSIVSHDTTTMADDVTIDEIRVIG